MDSGILSLRYAKALFRYTEERGATERVCTQVRRLLAHPEQRPQTLEPELENFVRLLLKHGRTSELRFMLRSYVSTCFEAKGTKMVRLTTAVPAPQLEERLRTILSQRFDCEIIFETMVNPALIGGFTLFVDFKQLDASVSRQIESIRRQFVKYNNRIV